MNLSANSGDSALRICGCARIPLTPHAPIAVNHATITGPNTLPMAPLPKLCRANNTTMITAVIGTTQPPSFGSITFRPSTEEITEIAGVIMLSPKNSDAPKIPSDASIVVVRALPLSASRRTRVISAMMPPSPSLSACITRVT